jgi:hypothetical protein
MSGKGSGRRPQYISDEEMRKRWEMSFPSKKKETVNVNDEHASQSPEGKALDGDATKVP